ncbi:uncharacterized protein LOC114526213 [Dendronephthya gigantea]|uniref:uncharacterized protein LOC114526213 n=1 Tax=Dendronephthya gigantea TaxID=151771 RepID=UPI00106C048D|nr:uncharacterized protein LOC114526213 [Dendronephthya gigantea]
MIVEKDIKVHEVATVKGATGRWTGHVSLIGTKIECETRLKSYETMLGGNSAGSSVGQEEPDLQPRPEKKRTEDCRKRNRSRIMTSDSEPDEEEHYNNPMENDMVNETKKVRDLLKKCKAKESQPSHAPDMHDFMVEIVGKLDAISNKLDKVLETSSHAERRQVDVTPKRRKLEEIDLSPISSHSPLNQGHLNVSKSSPVQVMEGENISLTDDSEFVR